MLLRLIQVIASLFLLAVAALHVAQADHQAMLETVQPVLSKQWRAVYFGLVAVAAAWLLLVTQTLRPVVVMFAGFGFLIIAMMEDPGASSFWAAFDNLTESMLNGAMRIGQG